MNYEELFKTDPYSFIALNTKLGEYGYALPKGTKVVPTEWAYQNGVCKKGDKGVIVGHSRTRHSIRVLKDGRKQPSSYWAGFWRDAKWKI